MLTVYIRLPVYIADILDICDPVLTFDQIMEEIEVEQYLKPETNIWHLGRRRYNRVNMLKTVLFGFMEMGYDSFGHDVAAYTAFQLGLTTHEGMGTIQSDLKHFGIPVLRERMHQYLRTGDASVSPVR